MAYTTVVWNRPKWLERAAALVRQARDEGWTWKRLDEELAKL